MSTEGGGLPLLAGLGIGLAVCGTIYSAMHFGYASWVGKRERAAEALVKRLESLLSGPVYGVSRIPETTSSSRDARLSGEIESGAPEAASSLSVEGDLQDENRSRIELADEDIPGTERDPRGRARERG